MKRSILFILVITFHCFGIAEYVRAEEPKKLAQATMTFLNIEVGARAVGMGGSFISMDNDATSLFWNPAGIAKRNCSTTPCRTCIDVVKWSRS